MFYFMQIGNLPDFAGIKHGCTSPANLSLVNIRGLRSIYVVVLWILIGGEFLAQRPVMRSFDVFFDLCLDKRLSKQLWGW